MKKSVKITPGMAKAMSGDGPLACPSCGTPIPKYPGRYPKTCPNCGVGLQAKQGESMAVRLHRRIGDVMKNEFL